MLCMASWRLKAPDGTSLGQQFCSQRFSYCLDYPASMFSKTYISPKEDSLVFTTLDTYGQVSVISTASDHKLDSHQAFDQRMRALSGTTGEAPLVLSIINGDDYYEVNFLFDARWYHQKAGFYRTHDVLFSLQVPVNRPELMMRLNEDVRIVFD